MKTGRSRNLQSAKYLQKKRKKLIGAIVLISLAAILFIIITILLLRAPFFQIKSITISGASTIDESALEDIIRPTLAGNYLFFIPRSNTFFYPQDEIHEKVQAAFPEIIEISSETKGMTTFALSIHERAPNIVVCDGFAEDIYAGSCFYADGQAYVFEKIQPRETAFASTSAFTISATDYFHYYYSATNHPLTLGTNFIPSDQFLKLQEFIEGVRKAGITPTGILVTEEGSYELYIENQDKSQAVVYFDNRTPFDRTLSNLIVFWHNTLNKKIGLTKIPQFDYINLRFGNNVFYLIKPDELPTTQ